MSGEEKKRNNLELREKFTKKMYKECPNLYRDLYGSPRETCMCWGFEVGQGWYPLLEKMSHELEKEIKWLKIEAMAASNNQTRCARCGIEKGNHWFFYVKDLFLLPIINFFRKYRYVFTMMWKNKERDKHVAHSRRGFFRRIEFYKSFYHSEKPCKEFQYFYPKAEQVKEKFGTLRVYMTSTTDKMDKIIQEAEEKSAKTCENCGEKGKVRGGGWIKVLCDECENNRCGK